MARYVLVVVDAQLTTDPKVQPVVGRRAGPRDRQLCKVDALCDDAGRTALAIDKMPNGKVCDQPRRQQMKRERTVKTESRRWLMQRG